jgi:hypothetical protein
VNTQQPPAFQNPYAALNVYKQREIKKYLEIYKQAGCQSDVERKACQLFEAQLPLEKVVVQDKEFIAYTDYRIHRSSKYLLKFDTKSETEILELWMARLAFKAHFELQSEFEKVTIMHINAQPDQVNPLITHQSVFYKEAMAKVPDPLKNIDNFIDLSITISLDEKIKPYVTHINFFN